MLFNTCLVELVPLTSFPVDGSPLQAEVLQQAQEPHHCSHKPENQPWLLTEGIMSPLSSELLFMAQDQRSGGMFFAFKECVIEKIVQGPQDTKK